MRRELRKWRKGGREGVRYKERKREYRELCDRKKKEKNKKWERRAIQARRENEVII